MVKRRLFGGRLRWMSAGAVVVVAGVLAGTMLANAASPALPAKTPAQLLAAMRQAKPPSAFSGVITENANLGFPSLPNIAGLSSSTLSAANWISGTHTVDLWYGGPGKLRIAVPVSFGETDLRVDGNQVWLWDSRTQTATHYLVTAPIRPQVQRVPGGSGFSRPAKIAVIARCLAPVRKLHVSTPGKKIPESVRSALLKCLHVIKLPGGQVTVPSRGPLGVSPLTPQQIAS
jgi:hypothetical protein